MQRLIPASTQRSPALFAFPRVESRAVVAAFDGGRIASDAGALLLGGADHVTGLTRRMASCFAAARRPNLIERDVETLVMQRVVGIALGYENLNGHDQLRRDPVMAILAGKLAARRRGCAPLAGKPARNRLELGRDEPTRCNKRAADTAAFKRLFVDLLLDGPAAPPEQVILGLDAAADPLHGRQEGRFLHGCLRHDPAQAVQARRPGADQRAPGQGRHGVGLPGIDGIGAGWRRPTTGRRLTATDQISHSRPHPVRTASVVNGQSRAENMLRVQSRSASQCRRQNTTQCPQHRNTVGYAG